MTLDLVVGVVSMPLPVAHYYPPLEDYYPHLDCPQALEHLNYKALPYCAADLGRLISGLHRLVAAQSGN